MRINNTSAFSSIQLGEGAIVPNKVQVLRVGSFNHPKYGAFSITHQVLSEMKTNFDNNIRGVDLCFDYFHDSDKEASAWVDDLTLEENGSELWAAVSWTPQATKKLSERELRYFSPDFAFKWTDPEKNVTFSNVLFGGGLTNRPFLKEMKAIVADETQGENMTDLEKAQAKVKEMEAANLKLSEQCAGMEKKMADMVPKPVPPPAADPKKLDEGGDGDVAALKAQIADLQAQLAKAQSESEVALAEKKKADEAKMLAEKTTEFNVLLSEGKACAAQKESFLKGDMTNFVKLQQPLNLKGSGSVHGAESEGGDDAKAIIKLAEEKQKNDPKLDRGSAISLAKKELKK